MHPAPLRLSLASLLLTQIALGQTPAAEGWLGVYLAADEDAAVVAERIPDSPAARAGLQAGDVILAVDGKAVASREALIDAVRGRKAGEKVQLKLRRAGKEQTVAVELAERPATMPAPVAVETQPVQPPKAIAPPAPVTETTPAAPPQRRAFLGLRVRQTDEGLVIDEALADGPAASLGIRPGERLTQFDQAAVRTLAELDELLAKSAPGRKVVLGLRSAAGARSVTVTLGEVGGRGGVQPQPRPIEPPHAKPPTPTPPGYDVEREIEELRRDLQDLRRQLEEMRRQRDGRGGRE